MTIIQPESDLTLNVVILGAEIISNLIDVKDRIVIEKVLKKFLSSDSRRNHTLFFDTLTFLFSMGLIKLSEYYIEIAGGSKQTKLTDLKFLREGNLSDS